jgi:penicillin-binding protein 1A
MTKRVSRSSDASREAAARMPRRSKKRTSFKKRFKTLFALAFLAVEIPVALVCVAFLTYFHRFSADLPNLESITDIKGPTATSIWSQDGIKLGSLDVENRQPIPLDKMPKYLLDATIAIEDHRFYEHPGVDLPGIARAAWVNLRGGSTRQGASTLTQQLVRSMTSLGVSREKNVSRKAKEILTAVRLEQFYSKKEILQLYLNNVYYGAGSYGIQAASETYFGKSAYKLSLADCALLAGLPQRPRSFTPFEHRKDALKRRDEVLDAMLRWGYISPDQCSEAKDEKPRIMPPPKRRDYEFKAPYFTRYVLRELVKKYGLDFVESGIRIDTTLDFRLQQAAQSAVDEGLHRNARIGANQAALISLDEANGYIRAMVGGRDFNRSQYNIATQGRRQPGSTFKIFDYAAAFDTDKFSLKDGFVDKPIPYPGDPEHRVVTNEYGETSGRWMNFKDAIKFSKNTIAIQVAQVIGMSSINEYAHKMGVTTELSPYLPTAIGATAIHPIDLCSAYSIIPNHGNRYIPMAIVRVTNADGESVDPASFLPQEQENILKPSTVSQLDEAFLAVCASGTGVPARGTEQTGVVENAHGKTGTTDEFRDVWFAGYTPELTTVVWVGSVSKDNRGRPVYNSMHGATGGHTCGQIWHDFMVAAVPIQRQFQAANPDLSDTSTAEIAAPTVVPAKRKRKVVPPLLNPTSPGIDPNMPDQAAPDSDGAVPAPPGAAGDTRPVEPVPLPDTGVSGRTNGESVAPRRVPLPNTGLRSSPPPATAITRPPEEEMISVKVCAETGDLVNGSWCPEYIVKRVSRSVAQHMHRCRLHHAPPGEKE